MYEEINSQKAPSAAFKVVLAVVISAIVVGGGMYYYLTGKVSQEKADLNAQISELEEQLASAQKVEESQDDSSASTTTNTSTTPAATVPSNEQICKDLYPNAVYGTVEGQKVGTDVCSVSKVVGQFAKGGTSTVVDENGGPGAYWIAANQNGKWIKVTGGQDVPACDVLNQYKVPAEIAGNECVTTYGSGQIVKYPN